MTEPDLANRLIAEASQLEADTTGMMTYWRDACGFCLPHRRAALDAGGDGTTTSYTPPQNHSDFAADALNVLASGMLSWVTPSQRNWFLWEPADGKSSGPVAEWLADCTQRAHRILANSNFYHALHLTYLDLGCLGTGALMAEAGKESPLNFRVWHTGEFWCAENEEGRVDRVFRKQVFTADQLVSQFGNDAPDKARLDVDQNKLHNKHAILHALVPDRRVNEAPFCSFYVDPTEKRIIKKIAHDSLPVFVTRWTKWKGDSPWGVSPAMQSLADIRGANYMEGMMATIANVKVNPRTIKSTEHVGQIILKAGGVTQVSDMNQAPKVWAEPGEYNVGLDLLNRIEERIRRAFHVPLFEQFSRIDDRVTATLVRAKQAEQLSRIAPAMTLQNTDLINPLMERVFMLLYKGGHFGQPPAEAFATDAAGQQWVVYPKTAQLNRMSMAIQEFQEYGLNTLLDTFLPISQIRPEVMDNLDADAAFRATARGKGLPKEFLVAEPAVQEMRQNRMQAQQAEQTMALMAKNPDIANQAAAALA